VNDLNSKPSLEDRIFKFLGTRPGAENIDKLLLTPAQRDAEKADFLLSGRRVVCEIKSLQTDVREKIDKILTPLMESDDAPVFYGAWNRLIMSK